MRTFVLERDSDATGISGTGTVAEGVEFSDGVVALRWLVPAGAPGAGNPTSVVFHDRGMESVQIIHGHSGATRIVWRDQPAPVQVLPGAAPAGGVTSAAEMEHLAEAGPMRTVELCRAAGYPTRHRNADYVLAAGLLPDRRPAHRQHQGTSGAHWWEPVDVLVLRVLAGLDTNVGSAADSIQRQLVRRYLAEAVRRSPDAPFLVGSGPIWMRAETAEEAVELLRGAFEGHAWVVPLAAIAAALAEPTEELSA